MARKYESLDAAAERLSVDPRTIRRMIARGEITGYRIGTKALRVDPAEVDAALHPVPTAG